jgi:hypothetical protein
MHPWPARHQQLGSSDSLFVEDPDDQRAHKGIIVDDEDATGHWFAHSTDEGNGRNLPRPEGGRSQHLGQGIFRINEVTHLTPTSVTPGTGHNS